jgi:hypothetical protein
MDHAARLIRVLLAMAALAGMSACNAVTTAIEHRNLTVENKMTDSVFLEPVSSRYHTVFLQIRNTTDQQEFDISADLQQAISAKGYSVVSEPEQAHYILQVNVLQVGKMDKNTLQQMFSKGYGALGVAGATAYGAGLGAMAGGLSGAGYGALIAAPVALVADAFVKDVTFAAITDVQISERTTGRVTDRMNQRLKQGKSGTRDVSSEQVTDQKVYQTRVMSSADRVNLELAEAMPLLKSGITRSISGMF